MHHPDGIRHVRISLNPRPQHGRVGVDSRLAGCRTRCGWRRWHGRCHRRPVYWRLRCGRFGEQRFWRQRMTYYWMRDRPGYWYRSEHRFRNRLGMHHGFLWRGQRFGLRWCRLNHVDRHNLWLWFDRHRLRQVGINQSPDHQCLYNSTDHQRPSEVILPELRGLNRGGEGSCIHTFAMSLHRPGRGTEHLGAFRCCTVQWSLPSLAS